LNSARAIFRLERRRSRFVLHTYARNNTVNGIHMVRIGTFDLCLQFKTDHHCEVLELASGNIFCSTANMLSLPFLAIHSRGLGEVSVTANVNATANSFAKLFVVNDLLMAMT
jgi:hypothetical protein